jgi:hypothetical protein
MIAVGTNVMRRRTDSLSAQLSGKHSVFGSVFAPIAHRFVVVAL